MMATLMLSQGVPMILGGDELGRSQQGNNNAYCHDDEISWIDWSTIDTTFLDWCRRLIAFRHEHPVFRRRRWFQGRSIRGIDDMSWFRPDGIEMNDVDWEQGFAQSVGVFLNGESISSPDRFGARIVDDTFLCIFSASDHHFDWVLPDERWGRRWQVCFNSNDPLVGTPSTPGDNYAAGSMVPLESRTVLVLRRVDPARSEAPSRLDTR
jgi:glycogen operon protein